MGITTNNNRTKEPVINNQLQESPLLLCTKCLNRIPFISLIRTGNVIQVQIKCLKCNCIYGMKLSDYLSSMKAKKPINPHCSYNSSHSTIASKYCIHCNKWLCSPCIKNHESLSSNETLGHCLITKEIKIESQCPIHDNEPYIAFCNECTAFICNNCNEQSHKDHQTIITFESINDDIKTIDTTANLQLIEYYRDTNKKTKETLIKLLNAKIDQINQLKTDIEIAYADNESNNKIILELLMAFKHNKEILKDVHSYEANVNMKDNWNVNKTESKITDSNIESNGFEFIKYLNSNYIVQSITEGKVSTIALDSHKLNNASSIKQINESNYKIELTNDIKFIHSIDEEQKIEKTLLIEDNAMIQKLQKDKVKDDMENLILDINDIKCLKTIEAHNDGINAIIQLIDGRLATASYDKSIKIWDSSQYTCTNSLIEHTDEIYALIQLKDTRLCSGSRDATIRLWDINTCQCIHTLTQHTNSIVTLLQLDNGSLVSGSADKTIRLWDISTLECNNTLSEHTDTVYCMTQLIDGRLVSGSNDTTIRLWNMTSMASVGTLKAHKDFVNCLLQLPNKQLLSGSSDSTLIIWDIVSLNKISVFNNNQSAIFSLLLLTNDILLIGTKLNILIINIQNLTIIKTFKENQKGIRSLLQLKNDKVASCSDDHTIKIWGL